MVGLHREKKVFFSEHANKKFEKRWKKDEGKSRGMDVNFRHAKFSFSFFAKITEQGEKSFYFTSLHVNWVLSPPLFFSYHHALWDNCTSFFYFFWRIYAQVKELADSPFASRVSWGTFQIRVCKGFFLTIHKRLFLRWGSIFWKQTGKGVWWEGRKMAQSQDWRFLCCFFLAKGDRRLHTFKYLFTLFLFKGKLWKCPCFEPWTLTVVWVTWVSVCNSTITLLSADEISLPQYAHSHSFFSFLFFSSPYCVTCVQRWTFKTTFHFREKRRREKNHNRTERIRVWHKNYRWGKYLNFSSSSPSRHCQEWRKKNWCKLTSEKKKSIFSSLDVSLSSSSFFPHWNQTEVARERGGEEGEK